MIVVEDVAGLERALAGWRRADRRIALVPTMGNLHDGHLALVERAAERGERVVVSIFVNPTQFDDPEDFARYPRTLEADLGRLAGTACDLVFAPSSDELYPFGRSAAVRVSVPILSDGLCGACRPGHFDGVATVVCRLFNAVRPDLAVFGEKDLQQLRVIERLVADLRMPIGIVGVPTVRESDGLAMSSRNAYLGDDERRRAAGLYRTLCRIRDELLAGRREIDELEAAGRAWLSEAGFRPEYVEVRRWSDLGPPVGEGDLVVLAAARLGSARLIDNLRIPGNGTPVPANDPGAGDRDSPCR